MSFLEPLFNGFGQILNFFYSLIPSYGIAISLFTVLLMALITPLTLKSTRSMLEMQRLQPELKRIQAQYKDDREQMNAAVMEFYREHSVNPLGGCAPMLAQTPVFIVMYRLIRGLTIRDGGIGSASGHIAGQVGTGTSPTRWILTDQVFEPAHLSTGSQLYQDLHATTSMKFLGMDLSQSALQAWRTGLVTSLPYLALIVIILISGIYQQRQIQARNTGSAVNPQQQAIMKLFPFFLPVFSMGFPAGLALYWSVQNLCRIVTNAYITRSVYRHEHSGVAPGGVIDTTAENTTGGAGKKSPAKPAKSPKFSEPGSGGAAGPGKSARSQAVHRKATATSAGGSGTTRQSGASGAGTGNQRKSGEARQK